MSDLERDTELFKQVLSSYPGGDQLKNQLFDGWSPPRRKNPIDEEIRELERLVQMGDLDAMERLEVLRRRRGPTPWTQFWDMHTNGFSKTKWDKIYIQAPEAEAVIIFQNITGRSPYGSSCSCCGPDYSISESETLRAATAYHRNCCSDEKLGYLEQGDSRRTFTQASAYQKLEEYVRLPGVLVIHDKDIKPSERQEQFPDYRKLPDYRPAKIIEGYCPSCYRESHDGMCEL
jgi:hypothetical protein